MQIKILSFWEEHKSCVLNATFQINRKQNLIRLFIIIFFYIIREEIGIKSGRFYKEFMPTGLRSTS